MEQEKHFADGMMWQDPHEKAPNFIKGKICINVKKFTAWLETKKEFVSEKGWLNIQLKESRNGTMYFELDTYKPTPKADTGEVPTEQLPNFNEMVDEVTGTSYTDDDGTVKNIPF